MTEDSPNENEDLLFSFWMDDFDNIDCDWKLNVLFYVAGFVKCQSSEK